ncbi:hypothetical protein llap_18386 [Limosa lapponica baueri]|uniref:Uncharacterized protein n=1 Tax=Limosa lapponica baueri TaxID=1758121 RepID=A0A2I0TBX2_LIMLA|nr:hypothetical protein llap_18386 [Limosa lapponica baueri]
MLGWREKRREEKRREEKRREEKRREEKRREEENSSMFQRIDMQIFQGLPKEQPVASKCGHGNLEDRMEE